MQGLALLLKEALGFWIPPREEEFEGLESLLKNAFWYWNPALI
jgi:hypothetical protein